MSRWPLVALGAVCVAVIAALIGGGACDRSFDAGSRATSASTARDERGDLERDDALTSSSAVDRAAVQAPPDFDPDLAFGSELVVVVCDVDGQLVADADVEVLDPGPLTWDFDTDEPRVNAELRGLPSMHVTSDARGRAKVTRSAHTFVLRIRAGTLRGFERIEPDVASPYVVYLGAQPDVRICTRDERGASVPGIELSVWEPLQSRELWRGVTDARGEIELCGGWFDAGRAKGALRIVANMPAQPPIESWIPFGVSRANSRDAAACVELVLPEGDDVDVRLVDAEGKRVAIAGRVAFRMARADRGSVTLDDPDWRPDVVVRQGVARIRRLSRELDGLWLDIPGAWDTLRIEHAGGTPWPAAIDLALPADASVARIRVLDVDGAPLRELVLERWTCEWLEDDEFEPTWCTTSVNDATDANGNLAFVIHDETGSARVTRHRFVDRSVVPQRTGVLELAVGATTGEVRLAPPEPVLAGRVVDGHGRAVACATVEITAEDAEGDWSEIELSSRAVTDSEGRFTAWGTSVESNVRVVVRRGRARLESIDDPELEFAAGARDVRVRVVVPGSIEGVILLPESWSSRSVEVECVDADGARADAETWRDGATRRFRVADLESGDVEVHVTAWNVDDPLCAIAGVHVEAATVTRDPRLWPLDLRELAAPPAEPELDPTYDGDSGVRRVVDVDGHTIDHGLWNHDYDGKWRVPRPWAGGAVSVSPYERRVAVWSPGYFAREFAFVHGESAWVLERAPKIDLALDLPPELKGDTIEFAARIRCRDAASPFRLHRWAGEWRWIELDAQRHARVEVTQSGSWELVVCGGKRVGDETSFEDMETFVIEVHDAGDMATRTLKPDTVRWVRLLGATSTSSEPR